MKMRLRIAILCGLALSVSLFAQAPSLSTIGKFRFDMSPPPTQDFGKTIASMASSPRCKYPPGSRHSAGDEETDCSYFAPYMSAYLYAISVNGGDAAKDWAPVDSVRAGATVADHIRTQSTRGPFGCRNGECSWVIASSTHPGSYFLCKVETGQAIPAQCDPILVENRGQSWLSVIVAPFNPGASQVASASGGGPGADFSDSSFMFNVHWTRSKITSDVITSLIHSALSKPRVSLTENRPAYGTSFTCNPRASTVNTTHWEMAQVSVNTGEVEHHFGVNFDLVYWINEQNTEREIDWHMPSAPQKARFLDEIRRNIHAELSSLCIAGRWSGDTLTCD